MEQNLKMVIEDGFVTIVLDRFDSFEEMCLVAEYEAATRGGTIGEYIDQYYNEGRFPINLEAFLVIEEREE